jgi:hypothetical protein
MHPHPIPIALLDPPLRAPGVVLHLTEEATVDDHAGAARLVMLQRHEPPVAVATREIGPGLGEDVRVQVDLEGLGGHGVASRQEFVTEGR